MESCFPWGMVKEREGRKGREREGSFVCGIESDTCLSVSFVPLTLFLQFPCMCECVFVCVCVCVYSYMTEVDTHGFDGC